MVHCYAHNCPCAHDKYTELMYHPFPNAETHGEVRQKWIDATKRENWQPGKLSKICSLHFVPDDYVRPENLIRGKLRLKKDAVPSIFEFDYTDRTDQVQSKKICRGPRAPIVKINSNEPESSNENNVTQTVPEEPSHKTVACQTTVIGREFDFKLNHKLNKLRREKQLLQQRLNRRNAQLSKQTSWLDCNVEIITVTDFE